MKREEFEELMKDRSAVSTAIMREIRALLERLDESGESELIGCDNGWEYNFKRTEKRETN